MTHKTTKTNHHSTSKTMNARNLRGFALVALMATALFLPSGLAANRTLTKTVDRASSGASYQVSAELPREWQWQKPSISFDHMYPSK
ncbi:MAG: hypothetical protein QNJ97_27685 [Myxococcota bacterium]|nr:hypothetical protein [Myxococcota bacterium]